MAVLLLAVLVRAQASPDPAVQDRQDPPPVSGMALIDDYRCRPGETRKVVVRGIEDDYARAGDEPARLRRSLWPRYAQHLAISTDYDTHRPDQVLSDWFEAPTNVASALLVIKFRAVGDNFNDALSIGDLFPSRIFTSPPGELGKRPGWKRSGDLHWAEIGQIELRTGGSLLDLVRSGGAENGIDLQVSDDTAVDFAALVRCEAPLRRDGVTLEAIDTSSLRMKGVAAFACRRDDFASLNCDPFVGDRSCRSDLPLLCFRDLSLPTPRDAVQFNAALNMRWSGGEVAATEPLKAGQFATISDADRHCAKRFGQGWRVAEWHGGGVGYGFTARGGGREFSGRYWVDIRGAPYGTCWSRDHGR